MIAPNTGRRPVDSFSKLFHDTNLMKIFLPVFLSGILFAAGCASPGKFYPGEPLAAASYLVVYGRESCPECARLKQSLDQAGMDYEYKDLQNESVKGDLYPRMEKAGMDLTYFLLPVVEVNGDFAVRPSLSDVLDRYGRVAPKPCHPTVPTASDSCREGELCFASCAE